MSVKNDDLKIPVLSSSVLQLLAIPRDDPEYVETVLQVASRDPGLTAEALRLANSAFFRGQEGAETLSEAIMRLGGQRYVSLVLGTNLMRAFVPSSPEMRSLWTRALLVACGNRYLSRAFPQKGTHEELAFFVGMLHDVGAMVLAIEAPAAYNDLLRTESVGSAEFVKAETTALGTNHVSMGMKAAKLWALPKAVSEVIEHHHEVDLAANLEFPHLVRLTQLAMSIEAISQDRAEDGDEEREAHVLKAANRFGIEKEVKKLSPRGVADLILKESQADFEALGVPFTTAV